MEYKGYHAGVEYDDDDDIFHGRVIDTRDGIAFEGRTTDELKQAFRDSVEDYLEFCAERGEEPEKPFSGSLPLRLTPELHRLVYLSAQGDGVSMNAWIAAVLERETRARQHSSAA